MIRLCFRIIKFSNYKLLWNVPNEDAFVMLDSNEKCSVYINFLYEPLVLTLLLFFCSVCVCMYVPVCACVCVGVCWNIQFNNSIYMKISNMNYLQHQEQQLHQHQTTVEKKEEFYWKTHDSCSKCIYLKFRKRI